MRTINTTDISNEVAKACVDACLRLPDDVYELISAASKAESNANARKVLALLLENAEVAKKDGLPICQDTGLVLAFVRIGAEVYVEGGTIEHAINDGVKQGYEDGYLRKSVVKHPLARNNTHTNTPAVIYYEPVEGDTFEITVAPKGGGSENMSACRMLTPSDGREGVVDFVVSTVREAGPNPCPPLIVGVGLGGSLDYAAFLSKKAILRKAGAPAKEDVDAELERDLLREINSTGVGPSGFGGDTTALAVHVESYPCHIASLPVAVTLQCHAARHVTVSL